MDKWCILSAQEICNKWSVGEFSRFCDDPPDFDSAESSDVAMVIWSEYQKARAEQDSGSRSPQATNTAMDTDSLSLLKAEIAALVNELNSGLSTVPAINLVCIALNKLRQLSAV